jgi:hypothetical protein
VEKEMKIINREEFFFFFVNYEIVSAVKSVEFVSDRMSYIVLRGRWCNIVVLNVHEPYEEKSDDLKDSFYEELEQFSKIFLSTIFKFYCNVKVRREDIFKPTVGNHQDSNDSGVRIVNFVTENKSC